jgi:predicted adenylyl cyclase CyaB
MSRNVEVKARVRDPGEMRHAIYGIVGNGAPQVLEQTDTYFDFRRGRLKLREIDGTNRHAELIFYSRPDSLLPCVSDYEIFNVANPEALKLALSKAHGVKSVVRKVREVYLFGDVRIHLDEVDGLGTFLEFEAVLADDASECVGEKSVNELLSALNIDHGSLVEGSYGDLAEQSGGTASVQ